ncbi:hypothetical protein [Bacteriophage Eos]|nr:hypothetical protein [Bacteriophage Eos]
MIELFLAFFILTTVILAANLIFAYRKLSKEVDEVHRLRGVYIETQLELNSCRRELRKFPNSSVSKADRFRKNSRAYNK